MSESTTSAFTELMRGEGWLPYRHGQKPIDTRKHNGEKVRTAFALDCYDRQLMSWVSTTKGIHTALVDDLMMQAEHRFGPNGKPSKSIEWLTDYVPAELCREKRAVN